MSDDIAERVKRIKDWQSEISDYEISDYDQEQAYEGMLDECYEWVTVCSFKYATSDVLKSVDPIAFRCGLADYVSAQLSDDQWVEIDCRMYERSIIEAWLESVETDEGCEL